MLSSERTYQYSNVLDLCYDIDFKTFRKAILAPLADELFADVEKAGKYSKSLGVPRGDVLERILVTFTRQFAFLDERGREGLMRRDEVLRNIHKLFGTSPKTNFVLKLHMAEDEPNVLVEMADSRHMILGILKTKQSPLIERRLSKDADDLRLAFVKGRPAAVDLKTGNCLNTAENFRRVTRTLIFYTTGDVPNLKEWRSMRADAKREETREAKETFLTAGL
jgi:hypothetical protein